MSAVLSSAPVASAASATATRTTAEAPKKSFTLDSWLSSINCSQYASLFSDCGIEDYDLVTQLDYDSLKELGVAKVGDLVRLERALNLLKLDKVVSKKDIYENFISKIIKYKLDPSRIAPQRKRIDSRHTNNTNHNDNNSTYLSESENDNENSVRISVTDDSTRPRNKPSSRHDSLKSDNDNSDVLKSSFMGKNSSTSTINSTESNESNASASNIGTSGAASNITAGGNSAAANNTVPTTLAATSAAPTPVTPLEKNYAIFILQNGTMKKMNTDGCYNAEAIKKKLLKRLNIKSSHHENYRTYYIDENDKIHLMFDVELVTLVRSLDRVERHRIIFCRSSEDPSSEALATSKKLAQKYDFHKKNKDSKSKDSKLSEKNIKTKYMNINTASSQNIRQGAAAATSKKKLYKEPSYARNKKELKPLYEQRPPSELISSNLAEYFPETPSKELHRTIKNSVRYSVRMSRVYSRLSMMSSASSNFTRNSIVSHSGMQNSPKTVGDVWMNNASELDEAVLGDDKEFMDIMSSYKRPRFVPSDAPPLPELELPPEIESANANDSVTAETSAIARDAASDVQLDTKSIVSGLSRTTSVASSSRKLETPKKFLNKRLSVAINSGKDNESQIELLDLGNIDSEGDIGIEEGEDLEEYQDAESIMNDLEDQSSLDKNTGPKHWLKGKQIGAGSFGVVYLGLNSFTGELMAVKQVEIPKVHELSVSTKKVVNGSDDNNNYGGEKRKSAVTEGATTATGSSTTTTLNTTNTNISDDGTLKSGNTYGSNDTIKKQNDKNYFNNNDNNKGNVNENDEDNTPNGQEISNKEKDHKKTMIDALQREMALLKELKHEKIVRYLGSSSDGTYLNIFLEYVPGGSITAMLNNYGPFKEPLIRNFTRQILIGLKYLHSKNIIHRDIKGGNILIDNNGGAKISDFGISKKIETSMQAKRASLQGSVYWMAPEVVRQITNSEKSDIWSVGCLIIEMFTGKHPFPEFSQMQAIFRIGTHMSPEIPGWCTEDCKDFLKKTFIIEYEKRPSAKELLGHPFLNSLIMSEQ